MNVDSESVVCDICPWDLRELCFRHWLLKRDLIECV